MIRGTTAQFKIKLPYTRGELEWVTMKWWQDGNHGTIQAPLPITKRLAHCSISNIYICGLLNDIVKEELYYFIIDDIKYKFTAPQNVSAGNLLKYDVKTRVLTIGEYTVTPEFIENTNNMTELTFINEVNNSQELYVSLTAEETMRFSDKRKAKMQLRGKLISDGRVFGCKPRLLTVYPINDDFLDGDEGILESDDTWILLDGKSVNDVSDGVDGWVVLDGKSVADASDNDYGFTILGGKSVGD